MEELVDEKVINRNDLVSVDFLIHIQVCIPVGLLLKTLLTYRYEVIIILVCLKVSVQVVVQSLRCILHNLEILWRMVFIQAFVWHGRWSLCQIHITF